MPRWDLAGRGTEVDTMGPCPRRTQAGAEAGWGGTQRRMGDVGVKALA